MPFESDNDDSEFDFENAYAIRRVYNIEANTYVSSISFESTDILIVDAQDPATSVTVTPPQDVVVSEPPLDADGAKMRVVCPDPEAPEDESRYAKSTPFWIGEHDATIQYHIDRTIPHLSFKHRVYRP